MKKYVIILAGLLIPLLLFSQDRATAESQHDSTIVISTIIAIAGVVVSVLSGGLAGAYLSIAYNKRKSTDTYKALLTAYCVEFINAFTSCITYYRQAFTENNISYSAIFDFSDVSFLSRFTEVCQDMSLINAIVVLKTHYFQVARHIERVSHFVVESEGLQPSDFATDVQASRNCMARALSHRKAAIGLFNSCYDEIVTCTNRVLDAAEECGIEVGSLRSKFDELMHTRIEIDVRLAFGQEQS